jgi:hypothetical protein
MALEKLDKSEWHPFFDAASRSLLGMRAEIEVASLDIGDQIEAEWLPLLGIVYDPKDDLIEVALEGSVDHIINHPREVWVDIGTGGLLSMEVVRGDDVREIIRLREPLTLPPPAERQKGSAGEDQKR